MLDQLKTTEGPATFTGNRGLEIEEPLLFDIGRDDATGVDIEEPTPFTSCLGWLEREAPVALPGLSEPETLRHYVRLSRKNYSIDGGIYPLGSCTMKHNPRLNEKMARLAGFADIHPLQPQSTVQGALEVMEQLTHWLLTLTNMEALALSPKAGAHGESCGLMAIKSAIAARGESATRKTVLVPQSAHGTNPASAALLGFELRAIPTGADGVLHAEAVEPLLGPDVAAIMLTNPNTCGLFERDIAKIAKMVRDAGGYFYCDGANFNAIAGLARPGDFGVDAMHINLHKTFSTPHGGGGPGAGPVGVRKHLTPYLPISRIAKRSDNTYALDYDYPKSIGYIAPFYGNFGICLRAWAYILMQGARGLIDVSENAVLNANYVMHALKGVYEVPYPKTCMHECVLSAKKQAAYGVHAIDIAKALIDEGFHPPTVYFPLIVKEALMIEPTETESKGTLDAFIAAMKRIALLAREDPEKFRAMPRTTPVGRLDETRAAKEMDVCFRG